MATAKNANTPRKQSLGEYLKGVRKEMGKVVWPTRKELGAYTVVVAATCAVCALGFWLSSPFADFYFSGNLHPQRTSSL